MQFELTLRGELDESTLVVLHHLQQLVDGVAVTLSEPEPEPEKPKSRKAKGKSNEASAEPAPEGKNPERAKDAGLDVEPQPTSNDTTEAQPAGVVGVPLSVTRDDLKAAVVARCAPSAENRVSPKDCVAAIQTVCEGVTITKIDDVPDEFLGACVEAVNAL